jgi:hypothetical protein
MRNALGKTEKKQKNASLALEKASNEMAIPEASKLRH